jgi:TatA/E family protein of Tat protein translocase
MLSLPHLIVLFVVALVIFGPQKLPELARMLGKATAEFRKMTGDFRSALEDEVREIERQTRIRDAEAAASSSPFQPPAPQPEGTLPRDTTSSEASPYAPHDLPYHESVKATAGPTESSPTEVVQQPQSEPHTAQPTTDALSTPEEKSPDDNVAV